jgi:organic hydroperoxide reductase OsmC/OhrA
VDIGKHANGTLGIRAELRVHVPGWPAADVEKLINEVKQNGTHCTPAR